MKNEAGTFLYPTSETEFTIRLKLTYFLFLLSVCGLHAQVVFSHLPLEYQLIPREANNLGTFTVSGTIIANEFDRIRSVVTDDNQIIIEDKTVFADTDGKFLVTHTIQSVLKEYQLKIYAGRDLEEMLVKRVTGIVCGDIYLIAGQSNAAAGFSHDTGTYFNAINKSHYNRGIGWGMDQALDGPVQVEWEYSFEKTTSIGYEKGFTGAWGMRIQKLVSENLGVPICVVNGARSGSPIAFNLPTKIPTDPAALNTNAPYDRIYAKLKHFGYQNHVKAIFWYQGEKDGGTSADSALKYRNHFSILLNSWKNDYPNIKKIFV
ncbi:MAG: Por secretion system C-terminal sorting protein, partial [Bacteroidetes bacterium]|nr:Por secretion system C-terminal sorting protein [Bacteroidota bacterium]